MKMIAILYYLFALLTSLTVCGPTRRQAEPGDEPLYTDFSTDKYKCIGMIIPSYENLRDFSYICNNLEDLLACSKLEIDMEKNDYITELFDLSSIDVAYSALCYDLMTNDKLSSATRICLQSSEEKLNQCAREVQDESELTSKDFSGDCRALVVISSCEVRVLRECDSSVADTVHNYYMAALPGRCKRQPAEFASPYDDWYAEKESQTNDNSLCRKIFMEVPQWMQKCIEAGPVVETTTSSPVVSFLERVCRDYNGFLDCADKVVKGLNLTTAFDLQAQSAAYREFCPLLPGLRNELMCMTNDTSADYSCDARHLHMIDEIERSNGMHRKVSLCRFIAGCVDCEISLFHSCSARVTEALKNFYIAAMPRACRSIHDLSLTVAQNRTRMIPRAWNASLAQGNHHPRSDSSKLRNAAAGNFPSLFSSMCLLILTKIT